MTGWMIAAMTVAIVSKRLLTTALFGAWFRVERAAARDAAVATVPA